VTLTIPSDIRVAVIIIAVLMNCIQMVSCKQASSAQKKKSHEDVGAGVAVSLEGSAEIITTHHPANHVLDNTPDKPDAGKSSVKNTRCPVCNKKKLASEDLCGDCFDEVANTCYRCGRYAFNVNGRLCARCAKKVCAICNRKKDTDDDLCSRCHNMIEEKGAKGVLQSGQ